MNKQQFTKHIADNPKKFGMWSMAAQNALETNQVSKYVHHWYEQYIDDDTRPKVKNILGKQLLGYLLGFYDEEEQ